MADTKVIEPLALEEIDGDAPKQDFTTPIGGLLGVDEDLRPQPDTTRLERWSYYLYYNGDNGVGPGSYSMALFQSVLTGAAFDPTKKERVPGNCTPTGPCVVAWGSGTKSVASVVLIANGICFAVMTVFFVGIGSCADYGSFGRYLLLFLTLICWAFEYGFMAIKHPSQWPIAFALYCIQYIAYGATLVFYAALFPRLARFMPHVRKARDEKKAGAITQQEYDKIESLERNHISNISTAHSNIGYVMTLVINLAVLLPLQGHSYANNWALFLTNSYWVVLGVWWFIFQAPRPGPPLPKGSSYFTIGWKQVGVALREIRHLPQTFMYLIGFFLLADGLNTTGTLVSIIQNDLITFSFLELTYFGLAQAVTSTASTLGFWYIQKYFGISTKRMFQVTNFFTVFIPFYGMLGLWTKTVGYHTLRDFWIYNILFGLFQAPYYAYAQTMMSEVTPRGYDNMFFGLFGITNRASSIIGPNVVQAIINKTNNNWMGFPFLFAICTAASIVIWCVDIEKGRESCRKYVEERTVQRVHEQTGISADQARAMPVDTIVEEAQLRARKVAGTVEEVAD